MLAMPKPLVKSGPHIGRPVSRVDGAAKVTGSAKYAAEFNVPGLVHGYVVLSAIARGRITSIDASAALALSGVLQVFTHENRPGVAWFDRKWRDDDAPSGSPLRPLYDAEIHCDMQPVALVVAETFELARHAARLVRVEYEVAPHQTSLKDDLGRAREPKKGKGGFQPPPKPRGDADAALAAAHASVDTIHLHTAEHHNPMEMHASTVVYEDDGTLTIYDKTQGAQNSQKYVCNIFGLPASGVRVKSPFVGGAFGSGLRPQYQLFLAVLAATQLQRSVRVQLTRPEMFSFGHRPETWQRVALGAAADGTLQGVVHEAIGETSRFEDYIEVVVNWSGQQYAIPNARLEYKVVPLDVYTPLDMRAPGAATGVPALEIAMDELAEQLRVDPVALRLKNVAMVDPNTGNPFTSKELAKAIREGAERFGWSRRNPAPRSTRDGSTWIGQGMACGVWEALQGQATARAVLSVDGTLVVSSATADIGTGTYTVMTQIAAESLGLPIDRVTFKLGDSALPMSPVEGGSWTVSSVGPAVKGACDAVGARLIAFAQKMKGSPLADYATSDLTIADGQIQLKDDPSQAVPIAAAMRAGGVVTIDETVRAIPNYLAQKNYQKAVHSAVFVEVGVDEHTRMVQVRRVVSAVAAGRIINPKTARSQVLGAVVFGIGQALHEESKMDHTIGRFMNHDLAEYHIPTHKDVPPIEVIFVQEHDAIINPLGAKGVGEIGVVGVSAAISNAIYDAIGTRVRDLPITLDKLLG